MAPNPVAYLVRAHERGTLLLPLPQSIYELRKMIKENERLGELDQAERQRKHLLECEQALSIVLSRLTGGHGEARCPVCHRRQETRGGVFMKHEAVPNSPMCSGSGRFVGEH